MATQKTKYKLPYQDKFHTILYIDYKFNKQEKQHIMEAVFDWELATKRVSTFDMVFLPTERDINLNKGILLLKVDSLDSDVIFLDVKNKEQETVGLCSAKSPIPFIKIVSNRLESSLFKQVVAHELGHLMGLEHTNEIDTLMYPTLGRQSPDIEKSDLKAFCEIYNCKN